MADTIEQADIRLGIICNGYVSINFHQLLFVLLFSCPIEFGSIDIPSPHLHNPSLPPDMTGRQQGIYTLRERLPK